MQRLGELLQLRETLTAIAHQLDREIERERNAILIARTEKEAHQRRAAFRVVAIPGVALAGLGYLWKIASTHGKVVGAAASVAVIAATSAVAITHTPDQQPADIPAAVPRPPGYASPSPTQHATHHSSKPHLPTTPPVSPTPSIRRRRPQRPSSGRRVPGHAKPKPKPTPKAHPTVTPAQRPSGANHSPRAHCLDLIVIPLVCAP